MVVLISVSAGIKGERIESWFDFAGLLDFGWGWLERLKPMDLVRVTKVI